MFRSEIHFELIFVQDELAVSGFKFLDMGIQLFQCHFLKRLISPPNYFCSFLKGQSTRFVWVNFWTLYCVLFFCVSVLLPVPHCLHNCSFIVNSLLCGYSSVLCWFFQVFCLSIYTSGSVCQYLWNSLPQFWFGMCWIYRSSWEESTSQSMNTEHLSIRSLHFYQSFVVFCILNLYVFC